MSSPILFDDFKPGTRIGETSLVYSADLARRWQHIFGAASGEPDRAAQGAGIATAMMMRAYLTVVAPRPPGNVHARQHTVLHDVPALNEIVGTEVACVAKEVRRERRYVELQVDGTGAGGRPLYRGLMSLIWAR